MLNFLLFQPDGRKLHPSRCVSPLLFVVFCSVIMSRQDECGAVFES